MSLVVMEVVMVMVVMVVVMEVVQREERMGRWETGREMEDRVFKTKLQTL